MGGRRKKRTRRVIWGGVSIEEKQGSFLIFVFLFDFALFNILKFCCNVKLDYAIF